MRLLIAAAATALTLAEDCSSSSYRATPSVHPWLTAQPSGCDPDLTGAWQSAGTGEVWRVLRNEPEDPDSEPCVYAVLIGDTALARALANPKTSNALLRDSAQARHEVAMDPRVAATWEADSTAFGAILNDSSRRALLLGSEGRIGGELFLDLTPYPPEDFERPIGWSLMRPAHGLWHVELAGDSMTLVPLSRPEPAGLLDTMPGAPAHESDEDYILVTAATERLYYVVLHHARDTLAFPRHGAETFVRWRPTEEVSDVSQRR